jgi:hypothetical protein
MVDQDMVRGYVKALQEAQAANSKPEAERFEGKAASHWFAMDVATQKAALAEAKTLKLVA